jgi:dihydrofolate synthase/folylpolyglutamate synthase
MSWSDLTQFLDSIAYRGVQRGLLRMHAALDRLDRPENSCPTVIVGGTNGKGSTARFLESILRQAGYTTGLTISPHVLGLTERIQINGQPTDPEEWAQAWHMMVPRLADIPLTHFEWLTLMAFVVFAQRRPDVVILEVGMGGRWDATNVTHPLVVSLTSIGLDHQEYLGPTLTDILSEKMGILREKTPVWSGIVQADLRDILRSQCQRLPAPLFFIEDTFSLSNDFLSQGLLSSQSVLPSLCGAHQVRNAAVAVGMVQSLIDQGWTIPTQAIVDGLQNTTWPGRLELWQRGDRQVWLDGAHNAAGCEVLADFLKSREMRPRLFFGCLSNRDPKALLAPLMPCVSDLYWLQVPHSQGLARCALPLEVTAGPLKVHEAFLDDFDRLESDSKLATVNLVAGSLYLVADVRQRLVRAGFVPALKREAV